MTDFIETYSAMRIDRSTELRELSLMLREEIDTIVTEDFDCDESNFVSEESSKFVFELGCMKLEYACEDIQAIIELMQDLLVAALDDKVFKQEFDRALAAGPEGYNLPTYHGSDFLNRYESRRLHRSSHVRWIADCIRDDLNSFASGVADPDKGMMYRRCGSTYIVDLSSVDLEYRLDSLEDVRKFLEAAADAALTPDDPFQDMVDADHFARTAHLQKLQDSVQAKAARSAHFSVVQ